MPNIVPISKAGAVAYAAKDLALIKRTVATDCNDDEFNLFIHTARHLGLDPLRRQVYAMVFSKGDAAKRRMSIIVGIDGFRSIAERTGNYRPDEDEPRIEYDDALRGPTNPLGIVKASVRVWKFSHGEWHPITGTAYWDEFAPVKDEWAYDETERKRRPTGKQTLDGQWPKMGRVMIAKCAESQALRRGWPDDFSNVYAPEEIDRARQADMLPSEAAAEGEKTERMEKIGAKDSVPMIFGEDGAIEMVPTGQVADRCLAFLQDNRDEKTTIFEWQIRNRVGLREFWAKSPGDALAIKKAIEDALTGEFDAGSDGTIITTGA